MTQVIVKEDQAKIDMANGTVDGKRMGTLKPVKMSKSFILKYEPRSTYKTKAKAGDRVVFLTLKR